MFSHLLTDIGKDLELHARFKTGEPIEPNVTVDKSFNILGAMMMCTGWAKDIEVLKQACLVVKP